MKNNSPLTKSILVFDASDPNRCPHLHAVPCKLSVRYDPVIVTSEFKFSKSAPQ
jgi:hypothetical protein